jgi:hypothetical protein
VAESPRSRRERLGPAALVAVVTFLPFAPGLLMGHSLYFRDLCRHFFPLRLFVVEGLRHGEVRYWNPLLNEGVPVSLPPISYPVDLLQALLPGEWGLSLLLALHVPLAGLAMMALARRLGAGALAAAGGGIVYALGGFALSTINLYVHAQALAWAPLVVLGLNAAAEGGRRELAGAGLATAICLSTTGIEILAQAVAIGFVLSAARPLARRWLRALSAVALGVGLAGPTLFFMAELAANSARATGFGADVVLSHSVHPLTFLQVVVGALYGDLSSFAGRFWGSNFFPRGFPYFLSLYLGLPVVVVAIFGGLWGPTPRKRLVLLALIGAVLALGRWAGLGTLVEAFPALRMLRYPTKVFFTVHFAVALLAAMGLQALLADESRRVWRAGAAIAIALGSILAAAPAIPFLFPRRTLWFVAGFFPPELTLALRLESLRFILRDAAQGGVLALAVGVLCLAVLRRLVPAARGGWVLVGLLSADLLREGGGLNPMVTPDFYKLSPEMAAEASRFRQDGRRVFTCDPVASASYGQARALLGDRHEVWSFAVLSETLSPSFNLRPGIATAYGPDLTMLVPEERTLPEAACASLPAIVPRLRLAGVGHVISLDPLAHPELSLESVVRPPRIAPLAIHVYALAQPVELPQGSARVTLRYRPRALGAGLALMSASCLALAALFLAGRRAES